MGSPDVDLVQIHQIPMFGGRDIVDVFYKVSGESIFAGIALGQDNIDPLLSCFRHVIYAPKLCFHTPVETVPDTRKDICADNLVSGYRRAH